jgi:hypothetical protein|uniref:Cytochrome b6-f complex subunit n=1 Tax=Thorea hispida TaxID=202687 RepID=A0A1C9CA88_9FLOR|nr:cytochrome b6-f complex subunit [Thorea hispida]AOM65301.1 cytochrome b6-f complex subunit [Thorea hispida]ARX95863.1 cytochrome b6-f complex subunit petP [Thorea hispida]UNJ79148.1 cytochrome b6-f complex subunit [Thorea hispida]
MSNLLNRKIQIFLSRKICKSQIIYYWGQIGRLKGTRYLDNKNLMHIIEFHDKTRIWIFFTEISNYIN